MGDIEEIYEDLDTDVSLEEFREAVESKVEQMGGLADEETAAMLVAHELDEGEVEGVADVEAGMEEAKFVAKVTGVGELRTFDRDGDGDEPDEGQVVNVEVADETGQIRATFWDEQAQAAIDELEEGDVLRIKGRPQSGYNGVEVSVSQVEVDEDVEVDVAVQDEYNVGDLSLGISDVTLVAEVLGSDPIRTFDRDDGSEGQVANLLVGDDTGRVRVTLWDERAALAEEFDQHDIVEIVDGYVREREGSLELHVGDHGDVNPADEDVRFDPDATPIENLEIDETADIAGVVRSADPKRTFEREDGSEGQVRNVRLQDDTDDIRVALWGEKADRDLGPGDEVLFVDVQIQDGWQDDIEASADWRSTVIPLEDGATTEDAESETGGLDAFTPTDGGADASAEGTGNKDDGDGPETDPSTVGADGEDVAFTGVVVQAGDPIILDDGERTVTVTSSADVELGEEVTVTGTLDDGHIEGATFE
ncbi:single-stranded DNA binding protein [Halanaeroarchaeum sulfurireducens]|uniref:Replication factor A n=1 Tax=Halanaeroarchaeum sulfurireducens TaxID=1604004 RepID=A0A0F7P6Z7_9EURY|nr:single-stranded DNA binding protein [Halanaeroarchaeum sulfurireducens]AKH96976.1 replication factor A [Halanaeroarchaeum sulfurireducens]ALG81377.1 replication factor A [Halanaeroarchaeum sulfurireducens]